MHKQPLLIMLVCFILGILFFENFFMPKIWVYSLLIFSFLVLFLAFIKNYWFQKLKFYFLGIFFFSIGVFLHFLNSQNTVFPDFKEKQNIVFQLNKKLNSNENYRRYEVSILKIESLKNDTASFNITKKPLNVIISVPKDEAFLDFKNYYQTKIYLNKVVSPSNDFQFNYAKYLSRKNIFHQSFAKDEILFSPKKSLTISEKIRQKRLEVLQKIDESTLLLKSKVFLKGIILADRTEMDAETVSDFSKSGLVHLLAISGSHMVIIFWIIMFFLKWIFPLKFRKLALIISLILIWCFAIFIDYGSSVMRSCLMISAYYMYVILQRKPDLLHALALAGFAILIVDTHQFFDVGFQLSFVAVLGIFCLNQPILKHFGKLTNWWKRFFANVFSVSLSAQIATLPLVIYYFHQYSLVSIFANLVIIPFSEIIIIFSLLMTILVAFNISFLPINFLYDGLVNCLLKTIHWFANLDFAFSKNIPMTILEMVVLFVAFYFLRKILLKKELKSVLRFVYIILFFIALRTGFNFYMLSKSEVVIANYFKEKIFLIKEKNAVTFYIDENLNPEKITKYIVDPYLASRRIANFEIKAIPKNTTKVTVNGQIYELE